VGTLASAAVLVWAGQLADRFRVRTLGAATIFGLSVAIVTMSFAGGVVTLLLAIFLLRFFGQGMMSHISMTAMGRWFDAYRGRALACSVFGYPLGEALLPTLAVLLISAVGWRASWQFAGAALLLVGLPAFLLALRVPRARGGGRAAIEEPPAVDPPGMVHWHRSEVLRDRLYWLLVPCVLTPSFVVTGLFFHQAHLAETKGWSLAFWAGTYPAYAVASVASSVLSGWAVDRFSGRRVLPGVCIPLGLALLVLASGNTPLLALIAMVLIGLTAGSTNTVFGALWPELYGTRRLGAIKALATAAMVFSSALGPGAMGVMLDAGISIERQCAVIGLFCLAVAVLARSLRHQMRQTQPALYGGTTPQMNGDRTI
ncbi:MAG: MFS transporter, partial [Pseudomonadota bacterium]